MSAILLVAPVAEPLTLAEAKAFLRVEHADDDALIAALIGAARRHVEAQTRRALLLQTWRLVFDAWPADGRIAPRIGPLRSLVAVRVYDSAVHSNALDLQSFVLDAAANVIASPGWALPAPGRAIAGIELDVTCGFGTAPGDVPEDLRQALRLLLAHWYDNRGVIAAGGGVAMPAGLAAALTPYRMLSL